VRRDRARAVEAPSGLARSAPVRTAPLHPDLDRMNDTACLLALVLSVAAVASIASCGGDGAAAASTGSGGAMSTGTSTSTTLDSDAPGHPPPPPPAAMPGDGAGSVTFAVTKIRFGNTEPNGEPDWNAWTDYGFDLDGKVSTASSTDLCRPVDGNPPKNVYIDGDNGIDNKATNGIIAGVSPTARMRESVRRAAGDRRARNRGPGAGDRCASCGSDRGHPCGAR
jgi:hypothetical protein